MQITAAVLRTNDGPFTVEELVKKVRLVLDNPPSWD